MVLGLALVGWGACGGKETTVSQALAPSVAAVEEQVQLAMAPDAAPPVPASIPEEAAEPRASKKLALKLRSTPAGAAASVDGRLIGLTPTRVDLPDDGRAHDVSFVLSGHVPWRLRFAPSNAGVIHATLRESVTPDAAPTR